jgi:signal transduction histidine kinase
MIKSLNHLTSFKAKLLVLITGITFIVLLLSTVSLALVLDNNFKKNLDQNTRSSLAILAYNLAPAVAFGDSDDVKQLLSSFKTSVDVVHASVYVLGSNDTLELMADYSSDARYFPQQDIRNYQSGLFEAEHFQFTLPIRVDDEVIGYLYQYSVFSQLDEFQMQMFAIFSATLLICLVLGMLISLRFQRILLAPLSHLVDATQEISQQKDYSIRVPPMGEDEFSTLSSSFNNMLDEIQSHHDKQLAVEEDIRQLNLNLENKVAQRTTQLEGANQYLKNALSKLEHSNNQLVEQEKMASLGGLVAGIAHEINTPLGISVTAISHLSYLIKNLDDKFINKKITTTYMREFIEDMLKGTDISLYNLTRAADTISNFKLIAVDQSSDQVRTIFLNAYLHEVVLSMHPKLKKLNHSIEIECDENLRVHCRAGVLVQIITNLVMNSIIHGFENMTEGKIVISAKSENHNIYLCYEDNGAGMSEEAKSKLFEPFYTTKRGAGGSGLGAHIVYNLVIQGLNGKISTSSELGKGLMYNIEFPTNEAAIKKKAVT